VEKTTKQGALCSVVLTKYYLGVKENKMGWYGGGERCMLGFVGET
jgi:hypothetical protein